MNFKIKYLSKTWSATYNFVKKIIANSSKNRITVSAASLSFHGILALLPAIIGLVGLLHLIGLNTSQTGKLIHYVTLIVPSQAASIVTDSIKSREATTTSTLELIFGLIVALWSLTGAVASLQVGLDLAYGIPHDRGFIKRRLSSLPLVFISVIVLLVIFTDLIGGTFLIRGISGNSGILRFGLISLVLNIARILISICLGLILLSVYYCFGSNQKTNLKEFFRIKTVFSYGAISAIVAWGLSLFGFSFYLDHFSNTTRSYGLFGSVVVLLLWLYITSYFLFIGAEINVESERIALK
jgi:membrane protein